MNEEKINRINELYRKSKAEGLGEDELQEQKLLRQEYIMNIRASIQSQMNNIDVVQADGSVVNLGEQHRKKKFGK